MSTCDIPIVDIVLYSKTLLSVISVAETVVNDVSAPGSIMREYEVTRSLEEVLSTFHLWCISRYSLLARRILLGTSSLTAMYILGIHITTTLIVTHIDKCNLHDSDHRTIDDLLRTCHSLDVLHLQGISGGDTNHIGCSTVITLDELIIRYPLVGVNIVLLLFYI